MSEGERGGTEFIFSKVNNSKKKQYEAARSIDWVQDGNRLQSI